MEERNAMLDKVLNWLGITELTDNITIESLWYNSIDSYHERVYLVTEKHASEPLVDVYLLRLFGFGNNISLSQDYSKCLSFDEMIVELPKIIRLVIDNIGD